MAEPAAPAPAKPAGPSFLQRLNPAVWTADGVHIAYYDPGKLFAYGYILSLNGTVFVSARIMGTVFLYSLLATLYSLGICDPAKKAPNGDVCGSTSSSQAYCLSTYGHICFFNISISDGLYLAVLASFLMGIFMQQTLTRWWTTRERVQTVMGQGTQLSILVSSYIQGSDEETKSLKSDLIRYVNLAFGLGMLQASGGTDMGALQERGLLTEEERNLLEAAKVPAKFMLVYHWAAQLLVRIAASGRIAFPCNMLPVMQGMLSASRGAMSDLFMFLGTQIPYTYSHVMTIIIKFHLFMVVIVAGSTMGRGHSSGSNSLIVWGYTLMAINTIVFEGLLEMHTKMSNPFGDDPIDFPTEDYFNGAVNGTATVLAAGNDLALPSGVKDRQLTPYAVTCCDSHPLNLSSYA